VSRRLIKSHVKSSGLTGRGHGKLVGLRSAEESGIPGVAVKCVDTGGNTRGESDFLGCT
jgi:hypothetical protein